MYSLHCIRHCLLTPNTVRILTENRSNVDVSRLFELSCTGINFQTAWQDGKSPMPACRSCPLSLLFRQQRSSIATERYTRGKGVLKARMLTLESLKGMKASVCLAVLFRLPDSLLWQDKAIKQHFGSASSPVSKLAEAIHPWSAGRRLTCVVSACCWFMQKHLRAWIRCSVGIEGRVQGSGAEFERCQGWTNQEAGGSNCSRESIRTSCWGRCRWNCCSSWNSRRNSRRGPKGWSAPSATQVHKNFLP